MITTLLDLAGLSRVAVPGQTARHRRAQDLAPAGISADVLVLRAVDHIEVFRLVEQRQDQGDMVC